MRQKLMLTLSGAMTALLVMVFMVLSGCNYERMNDQDSVKTYERKVASMDKRTLPVKDGFQALARVDPGSLANPLPDSPKSVEQGRLVYGYFCVQCHGVKLDGNGTVGQSFAPLPSDLLSPSVLSRKDGELYAEVRLGDGRHPALFATVSSGDTWAVILYMRSVKRGGS